MFRRLLRKFFSPVSEVVRKRRRRFQPMIEILEERRLLSNYFVNKLGDAGTGAGNSGDLRYCINQANANPVANTISFDATVFATHQTITLGSTDLVLTRPAGAGVPVGFVGSLLTITGPAAGVTIDAGLRTVAFHVDGLMSASGLTVANGGTNAKTTAGGGIFNDGSLTLTDCTSPGGKAANGGGLYNALSAIVHLNNCTISGSSANTNGGGLYNLGKAYVTGGSFSGNSAATGGGVWNGKGATVAVSGCQISDNTASFAVAGNGGGNPHATVTNPRS